MAAGDTQGTRWDVLRAIERLAAKQGAGTFTRCTLGDMLLELPSFEVRFWPGTKRERLRGGGGMQKKYSSISEDEDGDSFEGICPDCEKKWETTGFLDV